MTGAACGVWKAEAAAAGVVESAGSGAGSETGLVGAGRTSAWVVVYTESGGGGGVVVTAVSSAVATVSDVWPAADAEAWFGQESWTGLEAPLGPEASTEDAPASGFWTGAEGVSGLGSLAAVMFAPSSWTGTEAVLWSWTGTEETLGRGSLSGLEVLCGLGS